MNLDTTYPTKAFSLDVQVREIPWYVRELWQKGKINVMFGPEKSGKSRLLNWVLVNSFLHPNVLDMGIDWAPSRVLYLAAEELAEDVNARMLRYIGLAGAVPRKTLLPIDFVAASGMRLEFEQQRKWLEQKILDGGYDLVVIDPLRRVHGADENDNTQMSKIFNEFRRWTNSHGITLILLHHTGKLSEDANYDRIATWSRGASDLAAILDTAQFVDRLSAKEVKLVRAGRFRPVKPMVLLDGQDDEYVYRRKLGG